ncbi:MAG: hypothetical protein IT495_20020 [Gammaproteobacteria bacterium]|nr:hypothetical protein [Gammaproteobacteria bacterium]
MLEWYFPWSGIDRFLKLELLVWLAVTGLSWWIFWRTVVRRRPWLRRRERR